LFPPEVLQIEQLADLLPGAGRDHQSAWRSERLQPRRKIGGFADD
jgi:hypothetical protein